MNMTVQYETMEYETVVCSEMHHISSIRYKVSDIKYQVLSIRLQVSRCKYQDACGIKREQVMDDEVWIVSKNRNKTEVLSVKLH